MSGTNILMQLITERGPVIGESLLDGYLGSIELKDFSWGMHALRDSTPNASGGALGGMGKAMKSMLGMGPSISIQLEPLSFTKRFDIASSMIHTCIDKHTKIISASITVVHIRQGALGLYMPGFVLLATNGYFSEVKVDIQSDGNMAEVVESCKLNFQHITMTYLKTLLSTNVPTLPFSAGQNALL
jgi:type VI protein secretion system component Hcp